MSQMNLTTAQLESLISLQKEWAQYKNLDKNFWDATTLINGSKFRDLMHKTNQFMREIGNAEAAGLSSL